jgi:hypothetical protein
VNADVCVGDDLPNLTTTETSSENPRHSAIFPAVTGLIRTRARTRVLGTQKARIAFGLAAIGLFAIAAGVIQQTQIGWNEQSHLAQVRAFDRGTAIIDPWQQKTGDKAYYRRHYYGDKAPGLAFLALPVYHVARYEKLTKGDVKVAHLLVVFVCVIPATILLLLAFRFVERSDAGRGAAVAITLGFATLILPFATILFSHVLSTTLGFAAFYLLWRQRDRGGGLGWILAAGVLAGYAVSTEYPLGLLAVLLGVYVAWRREPLRPLLAYGTGFSIGVLPLLLYDWWAFGGPFHLSYSYVAANSSGVLGFGAPSLRSAIKLLVSDRGLLVVTPVVAAGIAGIVILYREGRRLDALIAGTVAGAYFIYNACYYLPFGGGVPGPRFMITMLPFLALPLAAAYRRTPIATLSLAAISAAIMSVATVTGPILSTFISTHNWWRRLELQHWRTPYDTVWIFGVCGVLAVLAALKATPRIRIARLDLELAALGVASWLVLAHAGPALLHSDLSSGNVWGLLALVALGAALVCTITYRALGNTSAWLAALPLLVLALRRLDHTGVTFGAVAVSLALLTALVSPKRVLSRVRAGRV